MYLIIRFALELSVPQNANNRGILRDGHFKISSVFCLFILKKKKGDFKLFYKRARLFLLTNKLFSYCHVHSIITE